MGIPVTEHRDFATPPLSHCTAVPHIWSRFVDAFVDFAVGGHVLAGRAKDSPRWTQPVPSGTLDPASDQSGTSNETDSVRQRDTDGPPQLTTVLPAADRVVAIGDIHGDIAKARQALRTAGLIDGQDRWTGKSTVLVQVGDLLDRGGQELAVVYLFEKLRREARQAGGAVHVLLGNHETGNFEGWFRYATREGRRDFQRWAAWERLGVGFRAACEGEYSHTDPSICDCRLLERTLEMLPGSMRMIMGHTIQQPGGINTTCKGKAIRVDVGMSGGCGGAEAEILEIRKDREVWVVRAAEELAGKPAKAHVLAGTEVPADKHGFWGKLREAMGTRVA
ncbi:unnamed protein product [Closterium sp. NIES-53]